MATFKAQRVVLFLLLDTGFCFAAGSQIIDVGPLRIPPPAGWVRGDVGGDTVTWWNVQPRPRNETVQCRISLSNPGLGANPAAFEQSWRHAKTLLRMPQSLKAPENPTEMPFLGSLKLTIGGYDSAPASNGFDFFRVVNVTGPRFGQAFTVVGRRAACEMPLAAFLAAISFVNRPYATTVPIADKEQQGATARAPTQGVDARMAAKKRQLADDRLTQQSTELTNQMFLDSARAMQQQQQSMWGPK